MKTSNKFLLAALLGLLASLTAYNMSLRAEFARGTYKDPLRNTTALNFNNFTAVAVPAAGLVNVKVVAGPFGVRVSDKAAEYVQVSQQGQRLVVSLAFPNDVKYLGRGPHVSISCPRLRQLSAAAEYTLAGQPTTDRQQRRGGLVQVQGFRQDTLLVVQNHATLVELADNQLRYLRAEAGQRPGSTPLLRIARSNRIQTADLRVQARGELQLEAGGLARLGTQFGDSVKVTLAGAGLSSLGQPR